jgi:hypothetical protein
VQVVGGVSYWINIHVFSVTVQGTRFVGIGSAQVRRGAAKGGRYLPRDLTRCFGQYLAMCVRRGNDSRG